MSLVIAAAFVLSLPRYRIVNLGLDAGGAYDGRLVMINNAGEVAGNADVGTHHFGFVISHGKLQTLHGIGKWGAAYINGITERGTVYGRVYIGENERAAIWINGVLRKINAPPSRTMSYEQVWWMNDRGDILGQALRHTKTKPTFDSFWLTPARKLRRLPSKLVDPENLMLDAHGTLYGVAPRPANQIGASSTIAFRSDGKSFNFIEPEIDSLCEVNDHGDIAGGYMVDADGSDGCVWHDGKRFDVGSHVNGLNNAGDAVGDHISYWENNLHGAYLWRKEVSTPLESLVDDLGDWQLSNASDINDKGEIVGIGLKNGKGRFFLLEPIH